MTAEYFSEMTGPVAAKRQAGKADAPSALPHQRPIEKAISRWKPQRLAYIKP
jgi:hypothetical protein